VEISSGGAGYVTNYGSITGDNQDGVRLWAGGTVDNESGTIGGKTNGVKITGDTGTVINNGGSITGQTVDGVYLGAGGSVVNENTEYWSISGNEYGVEITGGMGYVTNYEAGIKGTNHDGVRLRAGGTVDNEGGSGIEGNTSGVKITGGEGTVINNGSFIYGNNNDGVYMGAGGTVENYYGTIAGYNQGVEIDGGPGTVINSGQIIGDGGTAILLGNYSNTVTLQTGSYVQGNIVAGAAGTNAAFLQGDGSYGTNVNSGDNSYYFTNFQTLTVQADATGWNLTGTNTFSTNATVQTGLLSINGSLTTPFLTVSNGAVLGGSGTISGIVTSHGVISPGNSIGTLNIVGGLDMTSSIYDEQVNAAGQSDLINVTGTAIISNATVSVEASHSGIYGAQTVYTNLTATGGVLGTNAGVSIVDTPLFLTASLRYLGTNTVETILNRKAFVSVANTYNQHSVAGALDGVGVVGLSGTMSNLVYQFSWLSDAGTAQKALDSMSGEIHGSLGMLDVQQQDAFNNSIALRTGRMSAGGENGGYAAAKPVQLASTGSALPPMQQQSSADQLLDNVWLQGFGSFGHLDGDGNASGGDFTISGLSGGFDYRLSPEMLVGLAMGYSHDDASVGGPGASGSVDAIQFAGYGGYVNGPWHLDGIFSYGYLQTDTKRFINVGSIYQEADGSYDGNVFSLSTEGGYAFKAGPVTIEPTLGLNYAHLSQDSFQETGQASDGHNYGLNVNSVDMDSLRSAVGVRLAAQFGEKDGVQFIPALRAAWEHEFMDKTADVNASFIGGSGDFVVRGVELGADSAALGAGLTVAFNKALQGFVNYDAQLNERLSSHAISGGLSYSW
jgi:outer membrane autotransporter protein